MRYLLLALGLTLLLKTSLAHDDEDEILAFPDYLEAKWEGLVDKDLKLDFGSLTKGTLRRYIPGFNERNGTSLHLNVSIG